MIKRQVVVNNLKQGLVLSSLVAAGLLTSLWVNRAVAEVAGQFQFVQGDVSVIGTDGKSQKAAKGLSFNSGDKIVTGKSSIAQLSMRDDGKISVRQDSELQISNFRYTRDTKTDSVAFGLLRGAFRSVTGLIGINNKASYLVTTPTATIGVRGTDHEPTYIPPSGWSGAPGRDSGTYDRVYSGKTVLTSSGSGQQIEILPGQTGFVPKENVKPQLVYVAPVLNQGFEKNAQGGADQQQGGANQRNNSPNRANDQQALLIDRAIPYADYLRMLSSGGGSLNAYFRRQLISQGIFPGNPSDYTIQSSKQNPDGSYNVTYIDKKYPGQVSVILPPPEEYNSLSLGGPNGPSAANPAKIQKLGEVVR